MKWDSNNGTPDFSNKDINYPLEEYPNGKMKFSAGPCTRVEKDCTVYDTIDELLEYKVGGDRLRDIITQAEIIDRTL